MLVGVQGSLFHVAAGSHPVKEAWGSQDSLYRGQIQKLLQCCRGPYQVQFDLSTTYRFVVIEEKVKGQIFGSTGVKQVKMIQLCWHWSQNVHQVNTMKNQNSLSYERCLVTMVTPQKRSADGH